MKIQRIFYVLVLGLLMITLTGATGVMAQNSDKDTGNKSNQSCCPGGAKPVSECTPEEKAACQPKRCDTQTQKCDPSACSVPCDPKKCDSGN